MSEVLLLAIPVVALVIWLVVFLRQDREARRRIDRMRVMMESLRQEQENDR